MKSKKQFRRGSVYIVVLGSALAVAVIGLSALAVVRINRRSARDTAGLQQARFYAQSAIEMGLFHINADPSWRTTYPNGVWALDQPIGTGTYTLEGIDPNDADLTNPPTDPLVLTGTGVEGDARYKIEVTLTAESPPLSCLEVSAHANTNISITGGTVTGDQIISANKNVTSSGTVNCDVEAVKQINGSGYTGTTTTGIDPRTVPDPVSVFDYYIANGTAIAVPGLLIDNQLISPASNPFGASTNSQGIYVIDCQGLDITIANSRIVGTLVLLDPGAASAIKPEIHWEPAVANYPALLVRGSFSVNAGQGGLSESNGLNFNPPGTPYLGVADNDTIDSYPSVINGLVYVSVDLAATKNATFNGVVVVGATLSTSATLNLTYDSQFWANPPPGFKEPLHMVISDGSWRRIVN